MSTNAANIIFFLSVLTGLGGTATAQIIVDRPIDLNGSTESDRQVLGLSDATTPANALNARTFQAGQYRYAEVSGTASWNAVLTPTADPLQAGATFVLLCQDSNAGPVALTIDGQGPYPVHVDGVKPLVSGDVPAGTIVTTVFDGTAFQLTSGRAPIIRDCPSGFVAVNDRYCIEVAQHDTMAYDSAAVLCGSLNGRLCTWGEWYAACYNATNLGLTNMVGDYEWTKNAANANNSVRVVGRFSCNTGALGDAWASPARSFRCCSRR
ncbi:MAG: hypothetical protein IT229_09210 [Flavobacteriales bacterium]|nr:hypothetical protein [Flavobacteriales bacterium]